MMIAQTIFVCLTVVFVVCLLYLLGVHPIANNRTLNKRRDLIDRWKNTGDYSLAKDEFDKVSYTKHFKVCFWFRNPKKLYGPLTQSVWDTDQPQGHNELWWRCYKEIYLATVEKNREHINRHLHGNDLVYTLKMLGYNINGWLKIEEEPYARITMQEGAEEYEQIMAMQSQIEACDKDLVL